MSCLSTADLDLDLDPDIAARVERLARVRRSTVAGVIREAVGQYVAREERRELFLADARIAADRFDADGLHATDAEVDAWLAKLEAGEVTDPPECHV